MAFILLQPGESFEHVHAAESLTRLISGEVEFSDDRATQVMTVGTPVGVAAGCSHTIRNIGLVIANVECVHER